MSNELTTITPKLFEPIKDRFVKLIVDPNVYQTEVSYACAILSKNAYLAGAVPHTIQQAVLSVAQIGLSLNPVKKFAYLVPRYNRSMNAVECCLEPSYQGLVKLWIDSGSGKNISAQLIWEGDDVELDMASPEKVKRHAPFIMTGRDQGKLMGVYSIATLQDGQREVEVMSTKQVHEIRERSESYKKFVEGKVKSCIWNSDEGEMFRKTVIRRHFKYLPKSDAFDKVAEAVRMDESDYTLTDGQWNRIDRLLQTAEIPGDKRSEIERGMHAFSSVDANLCIEYLSMNQPQDVPKLMGEQARRDASKA